MNPKLFGLPPESSGYLDFPEGDEKKYPEILVNVGQAHYQADNKSTARLLWLEALRQTTQPEVQLEAAAYIIYHTKADNLEKLAWQKAAMEATAHVVKEAERGNSKALGILSQLKTPAP